MAYLIGVVARGRLLRPLQKLSSGRRGFHERPNRFIHLWPLEA